MCGWNIIVPSTGFVESYVALHLINNWRWLKITVTIYFFHHVNGAATPDYSTLYSSDTLALEHLIQSIVEKQVRLSPRTSSPLYSPQVCHPRGSARPKCGQVFHLLRRSEGLMSTGGIWVQAQALLWRQKTIYHASNKELFFEVGFTLKAGSMAG